jgi:Tol biopolymer transport system component
MNGVIVRLVSVIAIAGLASASSAGVTSSSMSWSPDSRWLCYTACHDSAGRSSPSGLVVGGRSETAASAPAFATASLDPARRMVYRIWADDQLARTNVLIEESPWPLSAPSWDSRGKSIAFGRFVPRSGESAGISQVGRLEVVVQKGLDEKTVVWTSPEFVLEKESRVALPCHRYAWSPDGVYLAVPRPGRVPSVELIRTDTGKRVHILDHAVLPAWSPDGSICAYIRRGIGTNYLEIVHRRGQVFGEPRDVLATGPVTAAPFWSADGRSILVVAEQTTRRTREYELVRCALDSSEPVRVLNLVPDPVRRVAKLRGIAIDFDKEGEISFHAADLENRESEVISSILRDSQLHRRIQPVDASLRIGAISVSPDGHCLAVRLGDPETLSHPAIWSTETEQTRLLMPDEPSQREWLLQLANAADRLLKGSLSPVVASGQTFARPTYLPLPGELASTGNVASRLGRIAELAQLALPGRDEHAERSASDTEASLLFNYLRGNFRAALDDLELLDRETTDLGQRLSLLSLRAVLRWAEGNQDEARQIIEYIVSDVGTATEHLEETPLGPVVTKVVSPAQAWAGFLSAKAAKARATEPELAEGSGSWGALGGPARKGLLELPDFPPFEPGGPGGPFAPIPAPDFNPPIGRN